MSELVDRDSIIGTPLEGPAIDHGEEEEEDVESIYLSPKCGLCLKDRRKNDKTLASKQLPSACPTIPRSGNLTYANLLMYYSAW